MKRFLAILIVGMFFAAPAMADHRHKLKNDPEAVRAAALQLAAEIYKPKCKAKDLDKNKCATVIEDLKDLYPRLELLILEGQ